MKKEPVILLLILIAAVFISGCAGQRGTLPAALSGQPYSYTMPTSAGGKGPFTCTAAPDSVLPSGLSFQGCMLRGTAPALLGVSEKVFSFRFSVTDGNGKAYGPFDAALPVSVGPPEFSPPELPEAEIGQDYLFNFCDAPTPLECSQSSYITGGAGSPYTFSATGLPLGLFLSSNGELSGKVPEGAQEGAKTFRVCAVDSARVEDCKDVNLVIKKTETREYRVSLRASQTYHGEAVLFLPKVSGGYTIASEDGSVTWEMDDVVITLTSPHSYVLFTSDDYDVKTDESGYYTTADNFRRKQFTIKAAGSASTSYDFSIPENGECRADSSSGSYDLAVPITLKVEQSGKLIFDIDEGYWKLNPAIEAGDIAQIMCSDAGGAEYILKQMAGGLASAGLGYVVFEGDGGTKTGQSNNPLVYTYAFSAANGGTNSFEWTLNVERVK